ncbi:MAG: hypothetical protein ACFE0Q_07965 [Anaerolineae bacterium]
MKRLSGLLLVWCALFITVRANEQGVPAVDAIRFPSYALVLNTELPALDRADLAWRLQGIAQDAVSTPNTPPQRELDELAFFRLTSVAGGGTVDLLTRLRGIGTHVYIWIEDYLNYDQAYVDHLADRFDREIYEAVRALWGSEPSPGIDGETRLHWVISGRLRNGLGGYFSATNGYSATIAPNSNEREMLVLNARILNPAQGDAGISTSAHEFQHMIHHHLDANEANWLNEGFSMLTEYLLGLENQDYLLNTFANAPQTALTSWGLSDNITADYGASLAFMLYLHERFGIERLQALARHPTNGLASIDTVYEQEDSSVDVIFADWVLANLLRQETGTYGYHALSDIAPMHHQATVNAIPDTQTQTLAQYATHYYRYQDVPEQVTISLDMADTVPIIPTSANSGQMMWYSQRGDNSNSTLTRVFDLRDVTRATLRYRIWYDLEPEWDYGYISISTDNGASWTLQTTDHTRTDNRNGRAYGEGYTGTSDGWLADQIVLNAYAGQEILVRFEMVTDDALNYHGIALDDFTLEAIGYQNDLEADNGGWQAQGWIHTDNRLPQRGWLQAVAYDGSGSPTVYRLGVLGDARWTLDLSAQTQALDVTFSPFAPLTTQPAHYSLHVE